MSAPERAGDDELADLRRRLRATRRVPLPGGAGWERGVDADYLAGLVSYWAEEFDWRPREDRIRGLPWATAGPLRVLHRRAAGARAPVVVLLHGWPDSVLRFERLLPLLDDVHVVVPALPGFPFALPTGIGASVADMATMVDEAMASLGYARYAVSAGDFGVHVAEHLAVGRPDRVAALHLTNLTPWRAASVDPADLTPAESEFVAALGRWRAAEGGYLAEQTTRPNTLAVGLNDSPAGLAAWIVEKLRAWSDCGGDVETVFSRDDLLTWVSAYWLSAGIGTSFGPYIERAPQPGRIDVPVVMSIFAHDMVPPPREFAQRFLNVVGWHEHAAGGHFAAWERPREYAADLRDTLASGRG